MMGSGWGAEPLVLYVVECAVDAEHLQGLAAHNEELRTGTRAIWVYTLGSSPPPRTYGGRGKREDVGRRVDSIALSVARGLVSRNGKSTPFFLFSKAFPKKYTSHLERIVAFTHIP